MIGKLLRKIPYLEALRAFLEQWGLWTFVTGFTITSVAALTAFIAWVESLLPYWAIAIVFIVMLTVLAALLFYVERWRYIRRQTAAFATFAEIDRESLAADLENMSHKIASLVGEFRGPIQDAWWRGNENPHVSKNAVEGKLIERYCERCASDVDRLIRRASKVVALERGDLWQIQPSLDEHSIINTYKFLAALADDVRTPRIPLPLTDRQRDEATKVATDHA